MQKLLQEKLEKTIWTISIVSKVYTVLYDHSAECFLHQMALQSSILLCICAYLCILVVSHDQA